MSCILNILGENFDVDDFLLKTKLVPYKIFHKDSPRYQTKPEGKKNTNSGCSIEISKAEFSDFDGQVKDVIDYLNKHNKDLQILSTTPEIQFATLNFGVDYDINKFVQSHYLPPELLKTVADLCISVELSIYQQNA